MESIFSGFVFQNKNLIGSVFPVMVAFSILVFDNTIKKYKKQEHSRKKMLVDIFTQCDIYIIIYGLIVFVFKIEIMLIIKIMIIQIFILIYSISKHSVSKASYKMKVIFNILFFSIAIGIGMYSIYVTNEKINSIDMLLYSIVSASAVSALFCSFIKLDTNS
ncbi:hypothetical protein G9F71_006790 [Clostridium sp. FP2]|uniref:hypothetical protein n=1 Tax=Clostridium TaxID=1485 RepID=UPI0013E99805|nr:MULTISPECIES: hypothetical protein [Clostridium]MBW9157702.1 hypothetical protein [Clostridium tagluense]MBZ9622555.1 hypothetical protein [Clostridium sp. FP2]WLC66846.1 hypothetical protein KTC93_06555 [Clostridium tagluense]